MARAAPQSQPYNRSSSSTSSRNNSSRQSQTSSSSINTTTSDLNQNNNNNHDDDGSGNNIMITFSSIIPSLLTMPLVLLHMAFSLLKGLLMLPFRIFLSKMKREEDVTSTTSTTTTTNTATANTTNRDNNTEGNIDNINTNSDNENINDVEAILRAKKNRMSASSSTSTTTTTTTTAADDEYNEDNYLCVPASPALTTLLDDALYRAYQSELVPTISAASRLLSEFIEVKEAAALIYRECRWMVGVPMAGGLEVFQLGDIDDDEELFEGRDDSSCSMEMDVAIGPCQQGVFFGEGVVLEGHDRGNPYFDATTDGDGHRRLLRRDSDEDDEDGVTTSNNNNNHHNSTTTNNNTNYPNAALERQHAEEMTRWNEYDTIQDFAKQCYLSANEAIQRLTTDRLAETANLTLQESMKASVGSSSSSKGANKGGGVGVEPQGGGMGVGGPSPTTSGGSIGGNNNINNIGNNATSSSASNNNNNNNNNVSPSPLPSSGESGISHNGISTATSLPSSSILHLADSGIGRYYASQPRRDCWESPRLYCPDYYWADDAIGGCQRLLKTLAKHRFVSLVAANGWDRYLGNNNTTKNSKKKNSSSSSSSRQEDTELEDVDDDDDDFQTTTLLQTPNHATQTPHVFPSLEAVHALQYLVSHLLPHAVPSRLNQFRAAVESNAVVSKRLYLVKCEYRAPMRALWESYGNLRAAPRSGLVERYLREYHGVNVEKKGKGCGKEEEEGTSGNEGSVSSGGGGGGGGSSRSLGSSRGRKGGSGGAEVGKKSAIQQQREKLEKLITEKYWKHPAFVEALQLERCSERMEIEMAHMLLPLSNLANEIMTEWKGRLRAVAVINDYPADDEEENKEEDSKDVNDPVRVLLGWREVPFMREFLRRLKSILRRKPDIDESTGIRPLLLDLQGVPRHKRDTIDSSIEMPFYPAPSKLSFFERFITAADHDSDGDVNDGSQWFHLEQFLSQVRKLLELLNLPNMPFLVEERMAGSKGSREYNKNILSDMVEQFEEVWDEEMFRALYQDWFDMVKRQQKLNAGGGGNGGAANPGVANNSNSVLQEWSPSPTSSLSELSEATREAEIELSIAMASKDQLERVHKRLEALRADKVARYKVLAHIVFDVGYRELNDGVVVEPPEEDEDGDDAGGGSGTKRNAVEFPRLANLVPGVFGDQLAMSGEELPVG